MFLSTEDKQNSELPRNCTLPENDWHILAGFWHPVAFSKEVEDKPVKARLLDFDLVLYRTVDGIGCARDLCIHRGAKLSLGWLDEERKNIVCPFHGLHYDSTGQCTKIPSVPDQSRRIPPRLCLVSYKVTEKYGLVWVCLKDEPIHPLPEWPQMDVEEPGWKVFELPRAFWNASASRHTENFNDVAHLSWVHVQTFGNRERPEIPDYHMEATEAGLHLRIPYTEVERMFFDAGDEKKERKVHYSHWLSYPFATDLMLEYQPPEGGETQYSHIYDVASPVSANETAIFQIIQTNIPEATAESYSEYQGLVNEEDEPLVASQSPEEIPLNKMAEIHIPADKFSLQYRRDMVRKFGLGAPSIIS